MLNLNGSPEPEPKEARFGLGYPPNISFFFNNYSFGFLMLCLSLLSEPISVPKLRTGLGAVGSGEIDFYLLVIDPIPNAKGLFG